MINSLDIFNTIKFKDECVRVNESIDYDIFLGREENFRLIMFVLSNKKPSKIISSNLIEVQISIRNDGKWVLSFILKDEKYIDIFCHFCNDMINSAVSKNIDDIIAYFILRYNQWQDLLKKNSNGLLSKEEVKGLIGEIYFLINYLFPLYDKNTAITSWVGVESNTHDFIMQDIWYEIKSVNNGVSSIMVSSIEQLDYHKNGKLVINYFDTTNELDNNGITLNKIINDLLNLIQDTALVLAVNDKLFTYGYIERKEYDYIILKHIKTEIYNVDKTFPAIRRSNIPLSIKNAKYELFISHIKDYMEGKKNECGRI